MQRILNRFHDSLSRRAVLAILVVAIMFGASHRASAQVLYGSLVGNVTDPKGAVIPSAAITVTNQGTGIAKTATTDPTGAYQFIDLQPGNYTLKVSVSGFKTHERRDIPVTLNNVTRSEEHTSELQSRLHLVSR